MNIQINGWVVLLILAILAMGYAAGFVTVKAMMPAAVAQMAGNQQIVTQLNTVLGQQQKDLDMRFVKVETRLSVIEKRK